MESKELHVIKLFIQGSAYCLLVDPENSEILISSKLPPSSSKKQHPNALTKTLVKFSDAIRENPELDTNLLIRFGGNYFKVWGNPSDSELQNLKIRVSNRYKYTNNLGHNLTMDLEPDNFDSPIEIKQDITYDDPVPFEVLEYIDGSLETVARLLKLLEKGYQIISSTAMGDLKIVYILKFVKP